MRIRLLLLLIIFTCAVGAGLADDVSNSDLLDQLDGMIRQKEDYEKVYLTRISNLKHLANESNNPAERSQLYRKIFDRYKTFDSDSALLYGRRALDASVRAGDKEAIDAMEISMSYLYAAIGLFENSSRALAQVDYDSLSNINKVDYLSQMVYLDTHREQFANITPKSSALPDNVQGYLDTIMGVISPAHPDYHYHIAYEALSKDNAAIRDALAKIEPALKTMDYSTQSDAKLLWIVSQLYKKLGDADNHQRYLTLSAITDMNMNNREIASLEELAQVLQQKGDLKRAYQYISHCQQCAELYKNRVRALRVASLQNDIVRQYQRDLESMQGRQKSFDILLILLIVGLTGTVIFILVQRNMLKKQNLQLNSNNDTINTRLLSLTEEYSHMVRNGERHNEITEELRRTNRDLARADYLKTRCIDELLIASSDQIDRVEEFRHEIISRLKSSNPQSAIELCRGQEVTQDIMKSFLKQFDSMFLSIYPDFVADFNKILRPEEQILLKKENTLNTDLRIFALVRLGITDSMTIAKVLRCAVQTVYNHRQQMRNKAVSKEEFTRLMEAWGEPPGADIE